MAKGASRRSREYQERYRGLAGEPQELRQMGRAFIEVGSQIAHRHSVLGESSAREFEEGSPRWALRVRDAILASMMTDFEGTRALSRGFNESQPLGMEELLSIFLALSKARVYYWEPRIHRAALAGSEQFDGTPFPEKAWMESIEFWVSPLLSRSSLPQVHELQSGPDALDGLSILQGTLYCGLERTEPTHPGQPDSPRMVSWVSFYTPFPVELLSRWKSGQRVRFEELSSAFEARPDQISRIVGWLGCSVGDPIHGSARLVAASRLFLSQSLASATAVSLGGARAERLSQKRGMAHPEVTVIGLRKVETPKSSVGANGERSGIDYSCRWAVRGHWVRREKKTRTGAPVIFYRHGHIKGPEDKPLKVPPEGIWHVLR